MILEQQQLTKAIKHLPKDVRKQFFQQYEKEIGFK